MMKWLMMLLLCMACMAGCNPAKRSLIKHAQLAKQVIESFDQAFPEPMAPFEDKPSMGSIGDLTATQNLTFSIYRFAPESLPALEAWLKPMADELGVYSVSVVYFSMMENGSWDASNLVRVTAERGGVVTTETGLHITEAMPQPSVGGKGSEH